MIQAGMADIILAGGMEHMSGIAYSVPSARWGCRLQDQVFVDNIIHGLHAGSHLLPGLEKGPVKEGGVVELFRGKPYIMGITAELIAQMYNLSREEIDAVALRSHNNTERATKEGDFERRLFLSRSLRKEENHPSFSQKTNISGRGSRWRISPHCPRPSSRRPGRSPPETHRA